MGNYQRTLKRRAASMTRPARPVCFKCGIKMSRIGALAKERWRCKHCRLEMAPNLTYMEQDDV